MANDDTVTKLVDKKTGKVRWRKKWGNRQYYLKADNEREAIRQWKIKKAQLEQEKPFKEQYEAAIELGGKMYKWFRSNGLTKDWLALRVVEKLKELRSTLLFDAEPPPLFDTDDPRVEGIGSYYALLGIFTADVGPWDERFRLMDRVAESGTKPAERIRTLGKAIKQFIGVKQDQARDKNLSSGRADNIRLHLAPVEKHFGEGYLLAHFDAMAVDGYIVDGVPKWRRRGSVAAVEIGSAQVCSSGSREDEGVSPHLLQLRREAPECDPTWSSGKRFVGRC